MTVVCLIAASPFYIYQQFNIETPIAEIHFDRRSEQSYTAYLATGDLCNTDGYELFGDQWQLDASFIKWNAVAATAGLKSLYKLDRLSGRYKDVQQQNSRYHKAYDISPELYFEWFNVSLRGEGGYLVDTQYGSSVFLDIDTSKIYTLYKTEDGLIAKAKNRYRQVKTAPLLTIEVNRACGKRSDLAKRLVSGFNDLAITYL